NLCIHTQLAPSQGTVAVTWLTYSCRLMYLPIGLFGGSIGTAVFPAVSRHAALGDIAGIRRTVSRGLAMMMVLNVPATFGLIVLATAILALLFRRGRLLPADPGPRARALRCSAGGP